MMDVVSVFLIDSKVRCKIGMRNEQLEVLSNLIGTPSERGMVNYLDNETIESLSTPKKYYISGNDGSEAYQLEILKELMGSNIEKVPVLKSMDNIYQNGILRYKLIGYLCEEDNGNQELFLYRIKDINLVKDTQKLWIFKVRDNATKCNKIEIEHIENGISLPTSDCIASIYKRNDSAEGKQYKVKVYDAIEFDDVFETNESKKIYVDRKLKRFISADNPIKLTSRDKVSVTFKNNDIDALKNVIYEDDNLMTTFASFTDNKKGVIKKISVEQLKLVLDTLHDYVVNNADAGFEIKNIPVLNKNKELEVTAESIPTFAALLDNKVIQRLLSNNIEIPYFKRHKIKIK